MKEKQFKVFEIDGYKTLPLHVLFIKSPQGGVPAMGSADCEIWYKKPEYAQPNYELTAKLMADIGEDSTKAIEYIREWNSHATSLHYWFQFKDDPDGSAMMVNLQRHTEIVSAICDSKLGIDTTPFWEIVRETVVYADIHAKYRAEQDHDAVWEHYANELIEVWGRLSKLNTAAVILTQRIIDLLRLRHFGSNVGDSRTVVPQSGRGISDEPHVSVFYSYSHRDEALRNELENHLALLKREGYIKQWHDRKIEGGNAWEKEIDRRLEDAQVVLMLVSSDFLASDYCFEVEMKRALQKHEAGELCVIPIILRSCDWSLAPFNHLQALPKDAMAVTSWSNRDEAFTDIAKGIRAVINNIKTTRHPVQSAN